MNTPITLSKAIEGYKLAAEARHLSPNTIADYTNSFRKFIEYLTDDPVFTDIDHITIQRFIADQTTVTKKTCLNYYTALAALWTWAVREGLVSRHVVHQVEPPAQESRQVIPFTQSDVKALLAALSRSRAYTRPGKRACDHRLSAADRNRSIIMLLLDTGLRASELCELKIYSMDMRNHRIKVVGGKGDKDRLLPFSARTGQALWRYLASRPEALTNEPLFATQDNDPMTRDRLLKLCHSLGQRAGVNDCHPHRFRHTFAVEFLKNGGNAYALQDMLGHTTMEMVKVYLHLAQVDLDAAHKIASPVDNWRL